MAVSLLRAVAAVLALSPDLADRLVRYDGDDEPGRDVFADYRIDEQIAKALDRKVWLPSGGYLVIDRTEAMTVIDVNTGKFTGSGGNLEETVTRNNLEAAEEIVRQLRLRDIGGIIVCDFIDMELPANRKKVLHELKTWLGRDRAKTKAFEVSELGLIEMTRQRRRPSLYHSMTELCEECAGAGRVLQLSTMARKIERQVRRVGIAGKEKKLQIRAHPAVALHLLEEEADILGELKKGHKLEIEVRDDPLLHRDDFALYALPGMRPLKLDVQG